MSYVIISRLHESFEKRPRNEKKRAQRERKRKKEIKEV